MTPGSSVEHPGVCVRIPKRGGHLERIANQMAESMAFLCILDNSGPENLLIFAWKTNGFVSMMIV